MDGASSDAGTAVSSTTLLLLLMLAGLLLGGAFLLFTDRYGYRTRGRILGRGLIVAGSIYLIITVVQGEFLQAAIESGGVILCALAYWLSTRHSLYWLAAGWSLHPLWDVLLHLNGGDIDVPVEWYAVACISFDLLVATYIVLSHGRKA